MSGLGGVYQYEKWSDLHEMLSVSQTPDNEWRPALTAKTFSCLLTFPNLCRWQTSYCKRSYTQTLPSLFANGGTVAGTASSCSGLCAYPHPLWLWLWSAQTGSSGTPWTETSWLPMRYRALSWHPSYWSWTCSLSCRYGHILTPTVHTVTVHVSVTGQINMCL